MLYDKDFVRNLLPQKEPFAFIDGILELQQGENAVASKNADGEAADTLPQIVAVKHFSGEEKFFEGHFPGNPVLPGVIQIETMAQAATLLTLLAKEKEVAGKRPAFIGVEQCRFKSPVAPPADLTVKVKMIWARRSIFKYSGEIWQGNQLVSTAEFSAAMV